LQTTHAATLSALISILEPNTTVGASDDAQADAKKPVIFILDEFDLFALRDQRQSLLYCLFDIVQSGRRAGGMAVVGLSARGDCINNLEKRLKSRCQSRLHLIGQPRSLQAFSDVVLSCLKVDPASVDASFPDRRDRQSFKQLCDLWNGTLAAQFMARSDIKSVVRDTYALSASKADLLAQIVR
jgi:Cdc6-like AAA superfamily ATPase